jgi:hypothetical protein
MAGGVGAGGVDRGASRLVLRGLGSRSHTWTLRECPSPTSVSGQNPNLTRPVSPGADIGRESGPRLSSSHRLLSEPCDGDACVFERAADALDRAGINSEPSSDLAHSRAPWFSQGNADSAFDSGGNGRTA